MAAETSGRGVVSRGVGASRISGVGVGSVGSLEGVDGEGVIEEGSLWTPSLGMGGCSIDVTNSEATGIGVCFVDVVGTATAGRLTGVKEGRLPSPGIGD